MTVVELAPRPDDRRGDAAGQAELCRSHRRTGGSGLTMRISLNLATRPFADLGPVLKKLRIAMGVLALAAIALGLGLHALDRKAKDARERTTTRSRRKLRA